MPTYDIPRPINISTTGAYYESTDTPIEVEKFLQSHGWTKQDGHWQCWDGVVSQTYFTWTEAIAYEMFKGIVMFEWAKETDGPSAADSGP